MVLDRPTLVFLPRPQTHRLLADERAGADVVCATVLLDGGGRNPISDSLPDAVLIELDQMLGVQELLALLFDAALGELTGRQALLDRLCEILMIKRLRHRLDQGFITRREGQAIPDAKLAALYSLTQEMVRTNGRPDAGKVAVFLDACYQEQHIRYIVLAISVKVLSNFSNHAFGTELDARFAAYKLS